MAQAALDFYLIIPVEHHTSSIVAGRIISPNGQKIRLPNNLLLHFIQIKLKKTQRA
jgi:hypothetical protein